MKGLQSQAEIIIGLKQVEIIPLQKKFGKNIFKTDRENGFFRMVWNIFREPMFIMLIIACALYFVLGEVKEGLLMLAAMIFVGAISVYQEVKSSKALAALNQYTQPKITVVRDGKEMIILSEDLVPGDVISLKEGDRIPADAVLINSNDLSANESVITGESLPVTKSSAQEQNQLFQGSTVNSGKGFAKITTIGNMTALGKLGKSITSIVTTKTLLQKQIGNFVKIMAAFGFLIFGLIWLINYLHSRDVIQSLLLGLTIAMAIIPEEIPVAFSSFMALGAFHMAKLGIITRQPLTIENLGAVSVICLDKTGTITENKMEVNSIYDFDHNLTEEIKDDVPIQSLRLLRIAMLASEREPFDAMEIAIVSAYERNNRITNDPTSIVYEYPLGGQPPMMTHIYEYEGRSLIAGKGAPERIIRICKLDSAESDLVQKVIGNMASKGLRVLGVCSADFTGKQYPVEQDDFNWHFEGLLALYDPPKKGVKNEFDKWYAAGIKVKLITGDYKETALHIANQVGMRLTDRVLTGDQLMSMSPAELKSATKETTVFARMFPDAKLKIIEALKENGETVCMLGDGVNDGPALKSANIGIAMGGKGTEIARDASDLILTDDRLEKVTEAIRQGRKIYFNLKKAIRYIISIHVPIIVTASVPLLLGWKYPNIFTPIHIIFLELIMGPTCSIFFEREPVEASIMTVPPRVKSKFMFTRTELLESLSQGAVIAIGILSLYYYFMQRSFPIEYVRTIVFTTIIISNVFLTFVNRSFQETLFKTSHYKNNLVAYILGVSVIFIAGISFLHLVQQLFGLTQIHFRDFILCLAVSLIVTMWFEVYKGLLKNAK
jgi:P-type Ca2+ transporter type 2C